jgi:hypothetical protein
MHRRADHGLDRLEATEVDDRDDFFATSEKLWPRLETTFGEPFNSLVKFSAKNPSIAARPCAVSRSPRATASPSLRIVTRRVSSSKCARKPASRSFRISIKNTDFGIQDGAAGSKPLGPFSIAKLRSEGSAWPTPKATRSSAFGLRPLTG